MADRRLGHAQALCGGAKAAVHGGGVKARSAANGGSGVLGSAMPRSVPPA
jgi:hypothetical protein